MKIQYGEAPVHVAPWDLAFRTARRTDMTKIKPIAVTALLAIAGIAATASPALAGGGTSTKVTIKGHNGDYYGYVKSSDSSCESNRKVKVYKMLGSSPSPKTDKEIGSDIAQPNGPDGMWSIGNSGFKHGEFYAKVKKSNGCASDISKVISR